MRKANSIIILQFNKASQHLSFNDNKFLYLDAFEFLNLLVEFFNRFSLNIPTLTPIQK
jgi:hypothetical protein